MNTTFPKGLLPILPGIALLAPSSAGLALDLRTAAPLDSLSNSGVNTDLDLLKGHVSLVRGMADNPPFRPRC